MRNFKGIFPAVAILLALAMLGIAQQAAAGYCGVMKRQCKCDCDCSCTCQKCYTVMKTCREVVYEPVERVCYDTVYEEVKEKVKAPAVKYVEKTIHRMMEMECSVPQESCCPAGDCCDTCAEPRVCFRCEPCIRKMPHKILVPVPDEKTEEITRVVERKIPRKVICYIPHEVCKQVPVEVCVPVPCCCKRSCCCKKDCCDGDCGYE